MAGKKAESTLTFALTIPQGDMKIPEVRDFIKNALMDYQRSFPEKSPYMSIDLSKVKCHLTNKETHYGKR